MDESSTSVTFTGGQLDGAGASLTCGSGLISASTAGLSGSSMPARVNAVREINSFTCQVRLTSQLKLLNPMEFKLVFNMVEMTRPTDMVRILVSIQRQTIGFSRLSS